jgi:ankyrin repeat protein
MPFHRWIVVVFALVAGAIPSRSLAAGRTAIVDAAKQNDAASVRALIARGVPVTVAAVDGTTALHWSAHNGDTDVATLLIRHGADVNAMNRYGITPLWEAAVQGSLPITQALLQAGAKPSTIRGDTGETVLMIAARSGHAEIARALLARGANVNAIESLRGQTALMWAAAEGHANVVRMLIEAGANTKAVSATKMSSLMFAIRGGDRDSVKALLDSGLDVNEAASDGTSMLVLALLNARFDIAVYLLDRGADANVDDPHGRPLHVLAFLRRADNRSLSVVIPRQLPVTGVDSFVMAKALLDHGADINARFALKPGAGGAGASVGQAPNIVPKHMALGQYRISFAGATPFYIAAVTCDVPFMKFLADHGADEKIPIAMGVTPLLAAAGIGFWEGEHPGTQAEAFEAVKLAYELGNDPKAVVDYGTMKGDPTWNKATAMHGAANRGADELVKWLAGKGVPLDTKSERGVSPWHIAAGLDGGLFHAWPTTAALLEQLAAAQGVQIDKREPPKPVMYGRPAAAAAGEKASDSLSK